MDSFSLNTLAIYGDSFADPSFGFDADPTIQSQGWPLLLKEHYDVTLYGQGGSSVYYSYDLFKQTQSLYDHIIFVETTSGRWYHPIVIDSIKYCYCNYNSLDLTEKQLKSRNHLTSDIKHKLDAIKTWYLDLLDLDHDEEMNRLMIEEIKRVRPDAIIIDLEFIRAWTRLLLLSFSSQLYKDHCEGKLDEIRTICHWPEEFNRVLAKQLIFSLHSGITVLPDITQGIPLAHNWTHYWKKK
jgi:hypothetical protein